MRTILFFHIDFVHNTSIFTQYERSYDNETSKRETLIVDLEQQVSELSELASNEDQAAHSAADDDLDDIDSAAAATTVVNESLERAYVLRQTELQCAINELDGDLASKKQLAMQMAANIASNADLNTQAARVYLHELRAKLATLEAEKNQLLAAIRCKDAEARKLSDEKRARLRCVESETIDLKWEERDASRLLALCEQSETNMDKLRHDIVVLGHERAKLVKQLLGDADAFRRYRFERGDLARLSAPDRKRLADMSSNNNDVTNQIIELDTIASTTRNNTRTSESADARSTREADMLRIKRQVSELCDKQQQRQAAHADAFRGDASYSAAIASTTLPSEKLCVCVVWRVGLSFGIICRHVI